MPADHGKNRVKNKPSKEHDIVLLNERVDKKQ